MLFSDDMVITILLLQQVNMRLGRPRGCLDGVGGLVRSHLIVTPHTHSAPERSGESLQTVQVLSAGLFGLVITRRPAKLVKVRAGRREAATNCIYQFICDRYDWKSDFNRPFFWKEVVRRTGIKLSSY